MKFVFVGNRRFVLEDMIDLRLDISFVFVVADSHLASDIDSMPVEYSIIKTRKELLDSLSMIDFDILISNGCPFILPVNLMPKKKYINIHPSYLPDLRGVDPTIGSILFERDSGATCHIMSEGIDSGDIISRVKIPYSDDLDAGLLYHLSFIAEKKAFRLAFEYNFLPKETQVNKSDHIYFSRSASDRVLNLLASSSNIEQTVKAFSNITQGAMIVVNDKSYKIHIFKKLLNSFLLEYAENFAEYQVMLKYERGIVFKKDKEIILLKSLTDSLDEITLGDSLVTKKTCIV